MIISIGRKLTCNLVLIYHSMTYSQWEYGLTLTGDGRRSNMTWLKTDQNCNFACADTEGGIWGPDPPRKSQVIWVSLNIMIRTPPPPPPLEKVGPPPWEMSDPILILGKV